jgi:ketose-bisphosphate aldolase
MPIVDASIIYERARRGGYAIGGFCAEHLDMVIAIIEAAEETRSPVIVFLYERDINLAGQGILEAIVKAVGARSNVPVGIHLDHGSSLKICLQAVMNGHTGVMIDASHESFENNIAITKQVAEICHELGAIVEGEIGTIPRNFETEGDYAGPKVLTVPQEAAEYVERTGVDCLAISIGEESGMTSADVKLDVPRLRSIAQATDAYLIMHGGSGTPLDQIRAVIQEGIVGIRFATEMRLAFFNALEKERKIRGHEYPFSHEILKPAREVAKELIKERMIQLGSVGQACTDGLCPPIFLANQSDSSSITSETEISRIVELVHQELKRRR